MSLWGDERCGLGVEGVTVPVVFYKGQEDDKVFLFRKIVSIEARD